MKTSSLVLEVTRKEKINDFGLYSQNELTPAD